MIGWLQDRLHQQGHWQRWAAGLLISAACVIILGQLVLRDLSSLGSLGKDFRPAWLAAIPALYVISAVLSTLVWAQAMDSLAFRIPMHEHVRIFLVTHATRRLPGVLWHAIGRIVWYERLGVARRVTAIGAALETALLIWSALFTGLGMALLSVRLTRLQFGMGLVLLVAFTLLLHPRVLQGLLWRIGQMGQAEAVRFMWIARWLAAYVLAWLVSGTMFYATVRSLAPGAAEAWVPAVAATCLAGAVGTLTVFIPSGLGLTETILTVAMSNYISPSQALAAALLHRVVITVVEIIVGLVVLALNPKVVGGGLQKTPE